MGRLSIILTLVAFCSGLLFLGHTQGAASPASLPVFLILLLLCAAAAVFAFIGLFIDTSSRTARNAMVLLILAAAVDLAAALMLGAIPVPI